MAATGTSNPLRQRPFVAALVVAVVVALGFGLIVPVLPLFARAFGVGLFEVTLLVSVFAAVRLFSNVATGSFSDRLGARRAIGWGALVVAGSSLLCAVAPGYWWLVAFRGVGGFGSALFINALLAHIVRIVPATHRGRAVGSLQSAFLVGIAFGPSVGGLLAAPLGLRWPFVIYAGFCAAAAAVSFTLLPERATTPVHSAEGVEGEPVLAAPSRRPGLRASWDVVRPLLGNRAFVAALLMMAASRWAAQGIRFSLVPVFGEEEIGASVAVVGIGLTIAAVVHLLLMWPAGKIADSAGRRALGAPAYFGFAVVLSTIVLFDSPTGFLVAMALYGAGTGFSSVTPPAIVGDVVPTEHAGAGVGVLNTAGDLGSVLGPLASGALAEAFGYGAGFAAAAVMLLVAAVAVLRSPETLPGRSAGVPGGADGHQAPHDPRQDQSRAP